MLDGWMTIALAVMISIVGTGCSSAAAPEKEKKEKNESAPADEPSADPKAADPQKTEVSGPLALVAIDVQKVFFDTAKSRNPKLDPSALQAKTARLFQVANEHHVPIFVTFEATKSGDHALPPALASAVPASATQIVKTTFDATGQPQFLSAVKASGAKRIVVVGAETDVCVMQSVLGLRRAGFDVITVHDAVFTEEVNTAPALRRQRQAGIVDIESADAEALLASGGASPAKAGNHPATTVSPFGIGVLLHDLDGLGASDVNASQKKVRLRELLLVTEWFELPVFAADPAAATAALPADLKAVVKRPILALSSRPSTVKQMAIAGGRSGIASVAGSLAKNGDVFVVEDTLVGTDDLEPLYATGAMPSTYKSLYYELIHSVDDAEWPSQKWVTDGTRYYYDATMAPESLPPLTVQ
jgi:nicotinamidase-related amidase